MMRTVWPTGRWRKLVDSAEPCWDGTGAVMPEELESNGEMEFMMPPRSFVAFMLMG
jgi:hypothetical protein